jgi:hypothetical protein
MCDNSLSSHAISLLVAYSWLPISLLLPGFKNQFQFIRKVISCNGVKETCPIRSLILIMHLYLSGMWVGVAPTTETKHAYV